MFKKENPIRFLNLSLKKMEERKYGDDGLSNGSVEYLSRKGKLVLDSILDQPLHSLSSWFDSCKFELFQVDLIGLIKSLDCSGNWEKALLLFEWSVFNSASVNEKELLIETEADLMIKHTTTPSLCNDDAVVETAVPLLLTMPSTTARSV
ncbi:uncharacterized protein LOC126669569 [Mercurialis annua]|uniref:uncharacterized protein LOC126669569 n=1 Tax=Mercurialis annua TaxID=3986 RepID=UPI00215E447E|nr:uncharacterized protein LOC126669569 [Mercurialis annua]